MPKNTRSAASVTILPRAARLFFVQELPSGFCHAPADKPVVPSGNTAFKKANGGEALNRFISDTAEYSGGREIVPIFMEEIIKRPALSHVKFYRHGNTCTA